MHINGILIDCSRLMERRDYYYRLIDFMADWKMNVLQLHFCDDHGLGIRLPGFSDIAAPNAFTPREIKALVTYATERGIEIIPELAAFGHIRYLTDHPKYAHLLVGKKSRNIRFNAIDPTNPESKKVIERLLRETVKLFPGPRVHVGCDEVDVAECCEGKENLDPSTLWADYVNSILDLVKKYDRAPLFWADHPVKDSKIRQLLDKDSTAVWWGYTPSVREADLKKLTAAGFKNTIVSPSIACWFIRFLGGRNALTNISKMAKFAANQKSMGVINTIWCPYRYVQGSLYYGLAYGAEAVRAGGKPDLKTFHAKFIRKMFGRKISPEISKFLNIWPEMEVSYPMIFIISKPEMKTEEETWRRLERINTLWHTKCPLADHLRPTRNGDIWEAMRLAAEASGVLSEGLLIQHGKIKATAERRAAYNQKLKAVRSALSRNWDATRFPDDPIKRKAHFPNERSQMMLLIMKKLPRL